LDAKGRAHNPHPHMEEASDNMKRSGKSEREFAVKHKMKVLGKDMGRAEATAAEIRQL